MSNDLNIEALLQAASQALRPFQRLQNDMQHVNDEIAASRQQLTALQAQSASIDSFRATYRQLRDTRQQLQDAKRETAALALALHASAQPAAEQSRALEQARQRTVALQNQTQSLRLSVQQQRASLNDAGIATRNLSSEQRRLTSATAQTSQHLNGQQQQLQRLNQQQAQQNQIAARYRRGQALAGRMRSTGAAAISLAKTGLSAGTALLRPGYDLAHTEATLQAKTGLKADSPQALALHKQARTLSVANGVSAQKVAQTQLAIAQAGGSPDEIASATPVALTMAQSNGHSAEENAALLTETKTAFGLNNNDVAHLGDVLNATLDQTGVTFDDLSRALGSVAPVAKNAGVGVEQAAAMLSLLAKNHITGAAAGDAVSAMLTRLPLPAVRQGMVAPGVKTHDENGDVRQILPQLKDIQTAFTTKGMGTAQQAEVLQNLFGAQAAPAASVLVQGAASGELTSLSATLQQSDGSTARSAQAQQDSLEGDMQKLTAAKAAMGIDLFAPLDGPLRALTQDATQFLQAVDQWLQDNPALANGIAIAAAGALTLSGALGTVGMVAWPVVSGISAIVTGIELLGGLFTVVSGTVVSAIGAISLPVVAIVAAIVGGALLIRRYWEPISAFISGVAQGFSEAMGPVGAAFTPLQPIFSWVTDKVKSVWSAFTQLLEPVKATQEQLAAAGNMGKSFGNLLGEALKIPGHALNQLMGGIDWVLDKLGIASSKSKELKTALPTDAPAVGSDNVATDANPQPSALMDGVPYRPASAPAAGGTAMQQNNVTYNTTIHAPAGMDPNEVGLLVKQQLEQHRYDEQNRQRSALTGGSYP
ncbi:phage tail tape measure protein [Pantoea sp. KPR_PJ]|uniref:phage tail tape measure protein n=1 Tax=Pantoea sp. KPR_PJ TaxID=2738375 RepID=UPI00352926FF